MKIFLIFIAVLFLLIFFWFFIERHFLITAKADIHLSNLPHDFNGLSILQISDIHHRQFGGDNSKISNIASYLSPDLIFLTGDMVSRNETDFSSIGILCSRLSSIAPVYFVFGNHELDFSGKKREKYISTLQNAGVTILDNSKVTVYRNSSSIDIAGTALIKSIYRDENRRFKNLSTYSLSQLNSDLGTRKRCTLLLAHNPLIADTYAQWNADAVFSGHVHGGIIRLPFIGGLLSPERRFFPKYTKGVYHLNNTTVYVSGGVGKVRLFNPAEVNFITLYSK